MKSSYLQKLAIFGGAVVLFVILYAQNAGHNFSLGSESKLDDTEFSRPYIPGEMEKLGWRYDLQGLFEKLLANEHMNTTQLSEIQKYSQDSCTTVFTKKNEAVTWPPPEWEKLTKKEMK